MAAVLRAAGLILFRQFQNEIQYLLLQTSYGEHHWTPPKGHVDPGETDWEAALRETQEEAGIDVKQVRLVNEYRKELNYSVNSKPKTVIYWLGELIDPNTPIILSSEHINFKWLSYKKACEFVKYDDMQEALEEAEAIITKSLYT